MRCPTLLIQIREECEYADQAWRRELAAGGTVVPIRPQERHFPQPIYRQEKKCRKYQRSLMASLQLLAALEARLNGRTLSPQLQRRLEKLLTIQQGVVQRRIRAITLYHHETGLS